ncbi:MAG TPA: LPS export ABC transporter periplasmic protein LptC [Thiolapillus brandeum]|uniref:LPS export ABC transporter periplasmic protein LptC n=1 Tax=Thiolapillus brandeum TaxID=1076588 RepID=A0A831KCB5_9GAMM|nr:LPS export ABC transporter periplasmic protein LptC [Thiolapillus brandeum]
MRIWLLSMLMVLLGITWWFSRPEVISTTKPTAGQEPIQDHFVSGLKLRQFDTGGNLSHVLQAQQTRHYLKSGITLLQQPNYVLYTNQQPVWRIDAEKGELAQDQSLLQLLGKTIIHREGDENHPPLHILSSYRNIRPEEEYAETAAPVTVTSDQNWIESVGMQAWLKSPGRIRFLAQTRAHYVAQ